MNVGRTGAVLGFLGASVLTISVSGLVASPARCHYDADTDGVPVADAATSGAATGTILTAQTRTDARRRAHRPAGWSRSSASLSPLRRATKATDDVAP